MARGMSMYQFKGCGQRFGQMVRLEGKIGGQEVWGSSM